MEQSQHFFRWIMGKAELVSKLYRRLRFLCCLYRLVWLEFRVRVSSRAYLARETKRLAEQVDKGFDGFDHVIPSELAGIDERNILRMKMNKIIDTVWRTANEKDKADIIRLLS